jgi:hypothetical protein
MVNTNFIYKIINVLRGPTCIVMVIDDIVVIEHSRSSNGVIPRNRQLNTNNK